MNGVRVKAEHSSPESMQLLVSTDLDIKTEPSSSESKLHNGVTDVHIKAEPSSPESLLPFTIMLPDIKVEPSSPPAALPHELVDTNEEEPAETALGSVSSESSKDIMDSSLGTSKSDTGSSQKKPQGSANRSHECDTCGRCFKHNCSLKRHQTVHTGEKQHKCETCGQSFVRKCNLIRHQMVHTGERPHACPECGRKFADKACLNRHNKLVHMKMSLMRHHTCTVCSQKFALKSYLLKHQRVHTGEMPYACQICPSKFCMKASLVKHEQLHAAGVQLYICTECGKSFKSTKALLHHLKWHNMEKPHSCQLCPASFTKKSILEIHVSTHKAEKSYKCPVCERLFCGCANLKVHMRRMHNGVDATVASTDTTVEVSMPSNPLATEPCADAETNEAGAFGRSTSVMPQTTGTEISGRIKDSRLPPLSQARFSVGS